MFLRKANNFQKGYFTAIILAILILTLLGILAQQVINHNIENETIEQLIITKHLTEERAMFEYNLKNSLQSYLDKSAKKVADNDVELITNKILENLLLDYNFSNDLGVFGADTISCDLNLCAKYTYTILYPLKKTITYNTQSTEIKIPTNYTIANTVVIG